MTTTKWPLLRLQSSPVFPKPGLGREGGFGSETRPLLRASHHCHGANGFIYTGIYFGDLLDHAVVSRDNGLSWDAGTVIDYPAWAMGVPSRSSPMSYSPRT